MYLNDLPRECLLKIFQFLPLVDVILGVRLTCTDWHKLSFNSILWKTVNLNSRDTASRMSDENFLNLICSISNSVEEIIFGYSLTISEVSILHEGIHCPNLVSVNLHGVSVNSSVLEKLLTKYPRMEELFLELTPLENCTQFLEFFKNHDVSCLKTLCVIFKLEEDFEKDLCEGQGFEETLSKNPILSNLNSLLADAVVRCVALQCFAIRFTYLSEKTLYAILCATKHLTHLNIAGCCHVTGKALNALTPDSALVSLNMDDTRVSDDALKGIAEGCHRLQSVSLENCLCVTDEGVNALAQNCPNISDFTLNHRDFNQTQFDDLTGGPGKQGTDQELGSLSVNPFLRITDIGIVSLVNSCHNLRKLGLRGCMATTDEAVEQIASSCPYLNLLNLSGCMQVSEHSVDSVLLKCRFLNALFLNNCSNVTKLTFPGAGNRTYSNDGSNVSEDVPNVAYPCDNITRNGEPLAEAAAEKKLLHRNSSDVQLYQQRCLRKPGFQLTALNLNFCNQICDASLIQIACSCLQLRKLFVRGCFQVTDSGIGTIAKMCPLLDTVDISGWSICSGEHMQLTDTSLIELSVHSQNLTQLVVVRCLKVTVKGICAVLTKCRRLRQVCVSTGLHFKISNIALHNCLQKTDDAYTSLKSYRDSGQDNFMVLNLHPYNKRLL